MEDFEKKYRFLRHFLYFIKIIPLKLRWAKFSTSFGSREGLAAN